MALNDQDLLKMIRKLLAEAADTTSLRQPWQEPLGNKNTIQPRNIQAVEAVRGFVGSWASAYTFLTEEGLVEDSATGQVPTPVLPSVSRLGQPGFPEIDFVPFAAKTNQFAAKGPSLIGHPISFEVQGPTAKSALVNWTWRVQNNGTELAAQGLASIYGSYGPFDMSRPYFVVITDCGGEKLNVMGKPQPRTVTSGWKEKVDRIGSARHEIFRIERITGNRIILAGNKPITDYFDPEADAATDEIRSIMIVRPYATRAVEVPGSDRKTFAIMQPEYAASGDLWPPFDSWKADGGTESEYMGRVALPSPRPGVSRDGYVANQFTGYLLQPGEVNAFGDQPGSFVVSVGNPDMFDIDQVVRFYDAFSSATGETPIAAPLEATLGYFEVTGIRQNQVRLQRKEEVNPVTGKVSLYRSSDFQLTDAAMIALKGVIHKALGSDLATVASGDMDILTDSRLTGLLDPSQVGRSAKFHSQVTNFPGFSPARADRAVFDTTPGNDPGNLLDLGFRAVLFPAVPDQLNKTLVPGFNTPVDSNEVVIDPNINEDQWIQIDYAAGLIHLSHSMPETGGDLNPNGDGFYVSCVAYSTEGSQRGTGVRVTGGDLISADLGRPVSRQRDVFSVSSVFDVIDTTLIDNGGNLVIALEADEQGRSPEIEIPETGWVTLHPTLDGRIIDNHSPQAGLVTVQYRGVVFNGDANGPRATFQLQNLAGLSGPTGVGGMKVVLRCRPDMEWRYESSRGSSVRSEAIRFKYADLTYNLDGSVTVVPTAVQGPAEELRAFFPLGGDTEVGRFHLNPETNRWTINDPIHYSDGDKVQPASKKSNELGLEIARGRLFTNNFTYLEGQLHKKTSFATNISAKPGRIILQLDPNPKNSAPYLSPNANVGVDMLTAQIEGALYATREVDAQPFTDESRVVFNLKKFKSGENSAAAPGNPIDWQAVSVTPAVSLEDVAEQLRVSFNARPQFAVDSSKNGLGRLYYMGRQPSFMPAFPFLISDKIGFPLNVANDKHLGLTVRSAHNHPDHKHSWISISLTLPGGVVYNTAADLCVRLNMALSEKATAVTPYYIGGHLDNAGFMPSSQLSTNPGLAALNLSERQFMFVANDDVRGASLGLSDNMIALICTGQGQGQTGDAFVSVVVEVNEESPDDSQYNLAALLGSQFVSSTERFVRCGWFWGSNSEGPQQETQPADWVNWKKTFSAAGNRDLGVSNYGTEPLGRLIGSFKISDADLQNDSTVYVCDLHTGSADVLAGRQHAHGQRQFPLADPRTGNQWKSRGYLERSWSHPGGYTGIDLTDETAQGFVGAFVSYGVVEHNEHGYQGRLYNGGNDKAWVATIESVDESWGLPNFSFDDVVRGDLVQISQYQNNDQNKYKGGYDCRVIETSESWLTTSRKRRTLSVLVHQVGNYRNDHDDDFGPYAFGQGVGLDLSDNLFINQPMDVVVSYIPSTSASGAGLVQHAMETLRTRSLEDDIHGFGTPREVVNNFNKSFTVVSGGRMSLYSPLGSSVQTGITFFSPSAPVPTSSLGRFPLAATYLESGVFSTSVKLGGGGMDSAGMFDAFSGNPSQGQYAYRRDTEEIKAGGVGGLRISGDAHVWVKNFRPVSSTENNAFVRIMSRVFNQAHFSYLQTGASASSETAPGAAHMPSGWSSAEGVAVVQEATVHLGLTLADLRAIRDASGDPRFPSAGEDQFMTDGSHGANVLEASQRVGSAPQLVSSLRGCFLKLANGGSGTNSPNEGVWRIVGAPMIRQDAHAAGLEYFDSLSSAGPLTSWLRDFYNPYRPTATKHHSHTRTLGDNIATLDFGHQPLAALVAVLEVRVERLSTVPGESWTGNNESFVPETKTEQGRGWEWAVYTDEAATEQLWVAEVVDPGGQPTGAPQSFRGLTLNPQAFGKSTLPLVIRPIAKDHGIASYYDMPTFKGGDSHAPYHGRLHGIHDTVDHRGRHYSRAFVSFANFPLVDVSYAARLTIFSSLGEDLESGSPYGAQGQFEVDEAGRATFVGMAPRLGPGILMDGGLGLVQATAFRATPRPIETEDLGSMTVYGRGAFPIDNFLSPVTQIGQQLPSVFNRAEVYDDLTVAAPHGRISIENPWAAEGLVKNWYPALVGSMTYAGPSVLHRLRNNRFKYFNDDWKGGRTPDTIFAKSSAGVKFKAPGGVVYDRAFRPLDATGSRGVNTLYHGAPKVGGIPGLEIPQYGEALLLPQGPPTLTGVYPLQIIGPIAPGMGETPLDVPLYEFINAAEDTANSFGINPRVLLSLQTPADPSVGHAPHFGSPGSVMAGYRHSFSREDAAFYGANHLRVQMRLLDGMVIEDVESGTFYSVGDVGRWKEWPSINDTALGIPGDGSRPPQAGSMVAVGASGPEDSEVLYDIGAHTDVQKPLTDVANLANGTGDKVVAGQVRRMLAGHNIRITPNVEFVPVLGPRGMKGSLLPPINLSKTGEPEVAYEGADAFFFDPAYDFKPASSDYGQGDVGKMLYICGTDEYKYTGWWVIIDVIQAMVDIYGVGNAMCAVVRKYKGRGQAPISGDAYTNRGTFPLAARSPLLRSASDALTNDRTKSGHFTGNPGGVDNLRFAYLHPIFGDYVTGIAAADMAGVIDAVSAAAFLSGDDRANGKQMLVDFGLFPNPAAAPQIIKWATFANSNSLFCYIDKTAFPDEALYLRLVNDPRVVMEVEWITRTDNNHASGNGYDKVGFYDYLGANTSADSTWGDRNNFTVRRKANGTTTRGTAAGLRWVFSSPLTEEHTGSYVHLTRPRVYRFGSVLSSQLDGVAVPDLEFLWTSGHPRALDPHTKGTEIFRINRCPTTTNIVLGGDCEIFKVGNTQDVQKGSTDDGTEQPVMYSPLSVWGLWPDAATDDLPDTGALNSPVRYAIQPIGREKIITVSPTSARSNTVMGRGLADEFGQPVGVLGVGSTVATSPVLPATPGQSFSLSQPWQLIGREDVMRNAQAEPVSNEFDSRVELNNSNNPDPDFSNLYAPGELPASTYCWSPAGEWWQLFQPGWATHGPDASHAPPTLRMDLTEYFTQAMSPGSGINSPHPDRAPKGARLNRIWVNFGVWGTRPTGKHFLDMPGYKGNQAENQVLDQMHMTFNLVLEIPGSLARNATNTAVGNRSRSSGTEAFPFGDRAPTAARTHGDNSETLSQFAGGTIVVPLYVNREAGDMMPNVMERFVSVGPAPSYNQSFNGITPQPDWDMGHYEGGFGCGDDQANSDNNHNEDRLFGNSFHPVLWGGIDFADPSEGGPFLKPAHSMALSSPFPRSSRMGGGVRSMFTSGIVADGRSFSKAQAWSLSSAAMTGITVAHTAVTPGPVNAWSGSFVREMEEGPTTCPHAFTMALTPVGDMFFTPKDGTGSRTAVGGGISGNSGDGQVLQEQGRSLRFVDDSDHRQFKVGNWLDAIIEKYNIPVESGSMLPPGARCFLEISCGPGPAAYLENVRSLIAAGSWIGGVKLSFDVETADGTAWSSNVNILGDEEG